MDEHQKLLRRVIRSTKQLSGKIALVDFTPFLKGGHTIEYHRWKAAIFGKHGPVLFCRIFPGKQGRQVSIELPNSWRKRIHLNSFLPKEFRSESGYFVIIPETCWQSFLQQWQKQEE